MFLGKAYLSITSTTFTDLVGYVDRPEEAEQLLAKLQREQGWTCDSAAQLIIPKRPTAQNIPLMRNEDQLQSLTQFVSFLENWKYVTFLCIPKKINVIDDVDFLFEIRSVTCTPVNKIYESRQQMELNRRSLFPCCISTDGIVS